uniref:Retrovirus-related Pol polyprotein from transposon TNT 1-94 n=1 Tax=Tanacetum cinerariifolium TaxID=118510 RepID=A0A699HQN7_TANCI|nr:retrovirus-related Pol polyprotein from transposon TNT 1-94 [Tanacetum cinerariifolium]
MGVILITKIYFIKGLGYNLFSVGQSCYSDLEVTFRRNTYIVRNIEGVDLLKGTRTTNLYTINIYEMASSSPVCLMARATSTKSWLWHQCLSHLNFDTINNLAKDDLVTGLPKLKYHKEHICPLCDQGKGKKASHLPKPIQNLKQRLHLLHIDLYGPMRVESINGKRYILVIMDDYFPYTWVHFLRSKDEAPEEIKTFLNKITVLLQAPVIILNGIVERRNQTLVEAARRMLIFSCAPLFLWAEDCVLHSKPLINGKLSDISFLHVFEALCYPKNDCEDIGKLGVKAMAFEQRTSKLRLQSMTSGQICSGLDLTYATSTIKSQKPTKRELDLLFEAMYDDYISGQPSAASRTASAAPVRQVLQTLTTSITTANTASTSTNSSPQATNIPNTSQDVNELEPEQQHV